MCHLKALHANSFTNKCVAQKNNRERGGKTMAAEMSALLLLLQLRRHTAPPLHLHLCAQRGPLPPSTASQGPLAAARAKTMLALPPAPDPKTHPAQRLLITSTAGRYKLIIRYLAVVTQEAPIGY